MKTIDLKKQLEKFYKQRRGIISIIDIPEFNFLVIDGKGDPNTSQEFQDAMNVLFSLSYTMKFMFKMGKKTFDYPVMPPEGLWWVDGNRNLMKVPKEKWNWRLMILQPEIVTEAIHREAIEELKRKKKTIPTLGKERIERFTEGLSAQILHVGPYSEEEPTIRALHEFIADNGYAPRDKHHEIYFGDPRRANPATLKTIVRQPIVKV